MFSYPALQQSYTAQSCDKSSALQPSAVVPHWSCNVVMNAQSCQLCSSITRALQSDSVVGCNALYQPHEGAYAAFVVHSSCMGCSPIQSSRGPQFSATAAVPSKRHIVVHAMPKRSAMMQQQSCGGTVTACDLRPYGNLQNEALRGTLCIPRI